MDPKTKAEARHRLAILETKAVHAARHADTRASHGAHRDTVRHFREEAQQYSDAALRVWSLLPTLPE